MSTNSSLRPYLDVIVRHSAVIRNIRIDYSSKTSGIIVFRNGRWKVINSCFLKWIPPWNGYPIAWNPPQWFVLQEVL
mgnify:CR=1 FL=1